MATINCAPQGTITQTPTPNKRTSIKRWCFFEIHQGGPLGRAAAELRKMLRIIFCPHLRVKIELEIGRAAAQVIVDRSLPASFDLLVDGECDVAAAAVPNFGRLAAADLNGATLDHRAIFQQLIRGG